MRDSNEIRDSKTGTTVSSRNKRKLSPREELLDIIGQLPVEKQIAVSESRARLWGFVSKLPVHVRRRVSGGTPHTAAQYCYHVRGKQHPAWETLIATDAQASLCYAMDVLSSRFEEAEPVIMKDPSSAVSYAQRFMREGWPEAEPYIATDGVASMNYAGMSSYERFHAGEQAMIRDQKDIAPHDLYKYTYTNFPKGWPAVEPRIVSNGYVAYRYAEEVLRGRFLIWEQAIQESGIAAAPYQDYGRLMTRWGMSDGMPVPKPKST